MTNAPIGVPSGWEEIAAFLWYTIPMHSVKMQSRRMTCGLLNIDTRLYPYRDWRVEE